MVIENHYLADTIEIIFANSNYSFMDAEIAG